MTDFFRDPEAFQALQELVIPKLFEGKDADDEVRVWVAGCSTGEEAYSIAILLREHLEQLRAPPRVQLFATDIDEAALTVARAARYPANVVRLVSDERLRHFFVQEAHYYRLVKEVRDMCIFSTHSLIWGSAVFPARPDFMPQLADLPEAGTAGAGYSAVSLFAAVRRLPLSRGFGERIATQRPVRHARSQKSSVSTPRTGFGTDAAIAAIRAAFAPRADGS